MNEKDLENVKIEIRSLDESVKNGSVSAEDGLKKLSELRSRKEYIEKQMAADEAPKMESRSLNYADIREAMMNKRSITLNGTGAINQVKELFKIIEAKTPVLAGVRKFTGNNSQTNIPVLTASPATNSYAEGAKDVSEDTAAGLESQILTPYAYVSLLPVSAEALKLGTVDIENELPQIFADAFAQTFHKGILTGDGTGRNFKGIFSSIVDDNKITCGTAATVKMSDVVSLALAVQDKTDNAVIIMNPAVYSSVMADTSSGIDVYRESLARDKTIEGVKVVLTSAAPSATATGAVVAVAGCLEDYAFGSAGEITIEPVKKAGDSNTYFNATVFANGKPIADKNFYGLIAK